MKTEPELTEMSQYILDLCNKNNLNMRKASMRCGLAPETISKILRTHPGQTPTPATLRAIAETLGGDYEHLLRLAGHLPPLPAEEPGDLGPEAQVALTAILTIWRAIKKQDPEALRHLIALTRMQAELAQTLLEQARTKVPAEGVTRPYPQPK